MNRLLAACLFLVAAPALAAVDPAILDAIKRVKPGDFPSANVVEIVGDQDVVYEASGQFTNTLHSVRLVLTTAGKADAASSTLPYAKDAETEQVLLAQVIKADGTVVPVPASDIQDVEQTGDMNIYDPNGRAVKVTFAGLAVGDAVEIRSKLTRKTPTRDNYFNDIFQFQSSEPALESAYAVDGPASLPLTSELYHPERGAKISITRTKVGDRIHYKWQVRNAPQLVPEPGMDEEVEMPMLVVTTDPSWQHFSQWWAKLTAPQIDLTPEMKAKVAELTKNAKSDDEKVKALYDFVASDIRYRGLGVGPRTGYTPRKASETFTSRWGVCRDVSILLTSLLRADGFQAYPVLTNMGPPVLHKIAYDGFNHAIVAMPKKGGGWTYLDPTAKNSSDLIPGMEAEQDTLVSTEKGEGLTSIPALDPAANLGHMIAHTTVNADGSLGSKLRLETKGMFDMAIRSLVAMVSKDQQRDIVEEVLHAALPDAVLVSYDTSSAIALWNPMTVDIEVKVPHAAVAVDHYRLLRTLVTSGALGLVENALPSLLGGAPTRKYMLDARVTFEYDQDETISMPAGTKVLALPNPARADTKVSSVSATCTQANPTTIECHRGFQLRSRFVDPTQYLKLRDVLSSLGRVAKQPVILGGV